MYYKLGFNEKDGLPVLRKTKQRSYGKNENPVISISVLRELYPQITRLLKRHKMLGKED